jgi:mannose-6-phosphate isomerase-like protein (cupin superfamily)
MKRSKNAVLVAAGHDRADKSLFFHGEQFHCKLSAQDTSGDLCVYDTIRKKGGPPLHYHHHQDEWFFVLDGEFLFQVGEDTFRLAKGDSILGPRTVPHAFASLGDMGRLMIIYQPAGTMEKFFADGSRLMNGSANDWQDLHRAHGMEIVGPPLKTD